MTLFKLFFIFSVLSAFLGCVQPNNPTTDNNVPTSFPAQGVTDTLIYGGSGSWRAEINSLKEILFKNGATYIEVNATELNAMSMAEMMKFKLFIIPGGNAMLVSKALSAKTRTLLRNAIHNHGLNYLGLCAGAWLAVTPIPTVDNEYGLGIIPGPRLEETFLQRQGLEYTVTKATFPDNSQRELLWYGGPVTPNIAGGVVSRFPDGTPAITQFWAGQGFVILSSFHPAANKAILNYLGLFHREAIAPDLAWKLLDSAIHKKPLLAF